MSRARTPLGVSVSINFCFTGVGVFPAEMASDACVRSFVCASGGSLLFVFLFLFSVYVFVCLMSD